MIEHWSICKSTPIVRLANEKLHPENGENRNKEEYEGNKVTHLRQGHQQSSHESFHAGYRIYTSQRP